MILLGISDQRVAVPTKKYVYINVDKNTLCTQGQKNLYFFPVCSFNAVL